MKVLIVVAALVGVLYAVSDEEWKRYKIKYNKSYRPLEDAHRRSIYDDNLEIIKSHNDLYDQGFKTYYLGVNQFADMTTKEFADKMNGRRSRTRNTPSKFVDPVVFDRSDIELPETVDWVKKGYVTPIKNQGQCGSCWSFSATGSMEGQHFKATGNLVSLSESNLMDCSTSYGNEGCNGGLEEWAFEYVIANGGVDTEASYPYVARMQRCMYSANDIGAKISSYKYVKEYSESALKEAVATIGPVSVGIDASHNSFQLYSGGVYNEPDCSTTDLDHSVLAVGYGTTGDGTEYWLVKNSWGTDWGLDGYIMMSRNDDNQCGIATEAGYPIV